MKESIRVRARSLPRFKGVMTRATEEDCVVFLDGKIVAVDGMMMKNAIGAKYRVKFQSEEQKGRGVGILNQYNKVYIEGTIKDGNIFVRRCCEPLSRIEYQQRLKERRQGPSALNEVFTGKHRSRDVFVPDVLKRVASSSYEKKKDKEVEEVDFLRLEPKK